jgi:hypothetical protein
VVLFTTLHVNLDLYTSGLTPLHYATAQAAAMIQVITSTYVECYDLPKVGVSPYQHLDLGHAIAVSVPQSQ